MKIFPVITKEKQELYEKLYTDNSELNNSIPCICGYYGRACRQMNDKVDRMPCTHCSLRVFISTVEVIMEICNGKEKIGVMHLYDSDILDIQNKLKKECVINVKYSYIEKVLDYLICKQK